MPWILVERKCDTRQRLQCDTGYNITTRGSPNGPVLVIAAEEDARPDTKGRICNESPFLKALKDASQLTKESVVLSAGIKLEAVSADLLIQDVAKPMGPYYKLLKRREARSEVIFLREGDTLRIDDFCIRLMSEPAEIQVNSSDTGEEGAEVPESDDHLQETVTKHESVEQPGKIVDEDLNDTPTNMIRQSHSLRPQLTPDPSIPRTEVVQETPTVSRTFQASEADMGIQGNNPNLNPTIVESTPSPAPDLRPSGLEMFSTAPMKISREGTIEDVVSNSGHASSNDKIESNTALQMMDLELKKSDQPKDMEKKPQMRNSKKRASEVEDDNSLEQELSPRPTKRTKTSTRSITTAPTSMTPTETTSVAVESQASAKDDSLYDGPKPQVAFSNSTVQDRTHIIKFLNNHGGKKVNSVKEGGCNVLCVRDGPLRKSMKLLLCIALGIPVVTDDWLIESFRQGKLLALDTYAPTVPDQEREWGTSLDEVLCNKQDTLFDGYVIFFTPTLKKMYHPFSEAEDVCHAAGALRTVSKITKDLHPGNTIVLASDEDDDAVALAEKGFTCYTKDLLTLSILRGQLDLESDDFKIIPRNSQPKKKGRPRKS